MSTCLYCLSILRPRQHSTVPLPAVTQQRKTAAARAQLRSAGGSQICFSYKALPVVRQTKNPCCPRVQREAASRRVRPAQLVQPKLPDLAVDRAALARLVLRAQAVPQDPLVRRRVIQARRALRDHRAARAGRFFRVFWLLGVYWFVCRTGGIGAE
jgi:hypothetical protein